MKVPERKESPITGLTGYGGGLSSFISFGNIASVKKYIDDAFNTYLYDGTGAAQTITNGIDLSGEGGMVWIKSRDGNLDHNLFDTERGAGKYLSSNNSASEILNLTRLSSFNSNGFSLGDDPITNSSGSNGDLCSWTFRKAPGFFNIVTWDGNSTAGRTVSHGLGSVPGTIIVKCTTHSAQWPVYHRSLGEGHYMLLDDVTTKSNFDSGSSNSRYWNNTAPTSTEFTLSDDGWVNGTGRSYVAYIFAHDDQTFQDGENESVIKCGSYTGNGGTDGPFVNLGWEPQWLMIKRTSSNTAGWYIFDNLRGIPFQQGDQSVQAQENNAEATETNINIRLSPLGFQPLDNNTGNTSGDTYIYVAIRKEHKIPTQGTEVFQALARTGNGVDNSGSNIVTNVGFSPDWVITRATDNYTHHFIGDKQRGKNKRQLLNTSQAEMAGHIYEYLPNGVSYYYNNIGENNQPYIDYYFKRAPKFFEQVCYLGNGGNQTINHKLDALPRLTIVMSSSTEDPIAYYVDDPTGGGGLLLPRSDAQTQSSNGNAGYVVPLGGTSTTQLWTDTHSTWDKSSNNGQRYHAYLFGDCPGVSKVYHYTGTGSSQDITTGFQARFVMIKRLDSTGGWRVFDTTQGMTNGSDPFWYFNDVNGGTGDHVRQLSTGFNLQGSDSDVNALNGTYMYLAIA